MSSLCDLIFTTRRYSRRDAVAVTSAVLSACARPPVANTSDVAIVRAASYDQTLYDTIRRLLTELKLDVRAKKVLLKPNLVEFDAGTVINTHPMLVHAVLEAVRALGAASVRIAEGPGHRRLTMDMAEAAGYFSTVPAFESLFTDLNVDDVQRVAFASPASKLNSLYLPKTALAADVIISLPKMKTHHWVGATLSMKNLFGLVPGAVYGWPKNILHWAGIDECVVDMHAAFPHHFAVVDGIEAMEGNGPIQGSRKHAGLIVAGRSLISVDATCCRVMGLDPSKIRYLQMAGGKSLSIASTRQVGLSIESARTPFRLIPELRHIEQHGGSV